MQISDEVKSATHVDSRRHGIRDITVQSLTCANHVTIIYVRSRVRRDFRTNLAARQTSDVLPPAPSSAAPWNTETFSSKR